MDNRGIARVLHEVADLLEINGQPERLDLPDHLVRSARDKGLRFVVTTDSHAVSQLDNLVYGVGQARRGWLRPADVLNTMEAGDLLAALRPAA